MYVLWRRDHRPSTITASGPTALPNYFRLADTAASAGNYAEAYRYYTLVLEIDSANARAWFGKGFAAGMLSTLADCRLPEAVPCFQAGLAHTEPANEGAARRQAVESLLALADIYFRAASNHLTQNITVAGAWRDFVNHAP